MKTIEIIALYGQLAHEKTAVCYDPAARKLDWNEIRLADRVTLEVPEDVEIGKDELGCTFINIDDRSYYIEDCVTQDPNGTFLLGTKDGGKRKLTVAETKSV